MADWFRDCGNGRFILSLHIQPGAKKSECAGLHGDALKIRLAAPPVDGKANTELAALFASIFSIPKRAVELLSGDTARLKRIKLHGVPAETAAAVVARLTHDT